MCYMYLPNNNYKHNIIELNTNTFSSSEASSLSSSKNNDTNQLTKPQTINYPKFIASSSHITH